MTAGVLGQPAGAGNLASAGSVFARVARFEWRNLRAERTLWLVATLFAVAAGYAAMNGRTWVAFQRSTIRSALGEESSRLAELRLTLNRLAADTAPLRPFGDPRAPSTAGNTFARRYAVMPPGPLAPLAVGQSDLYPAYFRVSMYSKETLFANDEIENPTNLLAGRFDLAFVIIYLYPLLILAVSYNLLSAEREQGTLALLLSQPVRLRTVLLAKVAARALLLFCLALGLSVAAAVVGGATLSADGALPRLALWVAVVALYGAFWFCVALLVNVFGRSSSTNALALLSAWLVLVVLVPSLLSVLVATRYPVPSRVELVQATREASNTAAARGSQLLAMYYQDHPELMQGGAPDLADFGARAIAVQAEVQRAVQPVLDRFDRQLARQQSLVDRFRFLSPAVVTQAALYDLAGTSSARYQHFAALVDDYVRELRTFFVPLVFRRARFSAGDLSSMPEFTFRDETGRAVLRRTALALCGLLAPTALIGIAALASVSRVSPAAR